MSDKQQAQEVTEQLKFNLFTGVWNTLTHADYKHMLVDLQTEAQAAVASGDPAMQKWGRGVGTLASLSLAFLNMTEPETFNQGQEAVKAATQPVTEEG